jgi:type IV pilus assembly protein PilY1
MKRLIDATLVAAALAGAALGSLSAHAEDIDLYAGTGGGTAAPNVLFFLDNSSNWSANSQAWGKAEVYAKCSAYSGYNVAICQNYVNQIFGSDSSLVQGQVELRALKLVLNEAVCSNSGSKLNINAGLMMFNMAGSVDGSSVIPGYMRHRIAPMSPQCADTNVTTSIIADLTNIDQKITTPDFKGASSAEYGAGLYEAFKYFGGYTRPSLAAGSTSTAGSPTGATGCAWATTREPSFTRCR